MRTPWLFFPAMAIAWGGMAWFMWRPKTIEMVIELSLRYQWDSVDALLVVGVYVLGAVGIMCAALLLF
jgi:hypothetical protein